ncbi:uncharacterized protein VP01_632g7 [Puccinia sorghi]|uniref:Uncharacterized protein n=1 Tax=Puccinia sorghi TaxID=27349 RepID=A0A0L6UH00_9BASI|nr:uncharacterized protein VP01_632g7 [Puccinia sorghi]
MPCCASSHPILRRRAIPSPAPVVAHPAPAAPSAPVSSNDGPIVLFPGEHPSDLGGAPFTTLPPSAIPTRAPTVTPRPATPNPSPSAAIPTPFATIGTSPVPHPTASASHLPTPSPTQKPDSDSQPQSSSTTTVAVVVSLIAAIVIGVIGYAIYRYHLRTKKGKTSESMKLRPLITTKSISRPILTPPTKPLLPARHASFRRSREIFGNRRNLKAPPPGLSPVQETALSAESAGGSTRKTRDFYTYETTDILESYGSETSYPSTYAAEVDFEYPVFRPSPAQVPRIHNVRDAYPTTPTEADDLKLNSSPSPSSRNHSARRLQNVPFKIPKNIPSQPTKPLRRL